PTVAMNASFGVACARSPLLVGPARYARFGPEHPRVCRDVGPRAVEDLSRRNPTGRGRFACRRPAPCRDKVGALAFAWDAGARWLPHRTPSAQSTEPNSAVTIALPVSLCQRRRQK